MKGEYTANEIITDELCNFGCNNKAKFQLLNGKYCCSKFWQRCNYQIFKNIQRNTGKNNPMYGKTHSRSHSIETIEKIKKNTLEKALRGKDHPVFGKKRSVEFKIKVSLSKRLTIEKIKEKHILFSKIEEMRYDPGKEYEKIIQVHCKNSNCENSLEKGGWFTPTKSQIHERIRQIEKENGNQSGYFYCSDHCKNTCSIFNKSVSQLIKKDQIIAGHIEESWYTSTEYQIWRQHVFEIDNSTCQFCGDPAEHAHHILPQKTHPHLAIDPDNGIACCSECHYKHGHRDPWCTFGFLSQLVCERIIKIKGFNNVK